MTLRPVVLEAKGLSVIAGNRQTLNQITLTIRQGERVAIVGSNGAGKTTFLRAIAGFQPLAGGTLAVLEETVSSSTPQKQVRALRAQIGQVFQGLHLVPRLTALENVLIGALARNPGLKVWARIFPKVEIDRAHEALDWVGLVNKAAIRTDRLSGGEKQKVAIARVITQGASLILADEPTASLDPDASQEIGRLLSRLTERRDVTLITVLHTSTLLSLLSERVIGIKEGGISFDMPLQKLTEQTLAGLYRKEERRHAIAAL